MFRNDSHAHSPSGDPKKGRPDGLLAGLRRTARKAGDGLASAGAAAASLAGSLIPGPLGERMRRTAGNVGGNPFEAAVNAAAGAADAAGAAADGAPAGSDAAADGMMAELLRHSIRLNPLVKRRAFPDLAGVPRTMSLGWAQLNEGPDATLSIGLFAGADSFSQIALADGHGRVFVTTDPHADTHGMEPRFLFFKEEELDSVAASRIGRGPSTAAKGGAEPDGTVHAIQGGMVGRDLTGRMTWLASWLKTGNRYTLEQLRENLPAAMRQGLEYRDAITLGFLAAYMMPQMSGMLVGFGSGNIFRRLNREAPIGAIRRSVRDTLEARAHGLRASGLEDHFADLMNEAGALGNTPGLEAVHGAEPLHLYTSSYSGGYFLAWDADLEFESALQALRIEGNLNRFSQVSAWIERSARSGGVTEDTVTRAQAAQIDLALLRDPALMALPWPSGARTPLIDPLHDDGAEAIEHVIAHAQRTAASIIAGKDGVAASASPQAPTSGSPWAYRRTVSLLLRQLRLPYRFDTEFRSNYETGETAVAFTTAGPLMMPRSRYDERAHEWKALSADARTSMSAVYNLRVGLIIAAMCFAADERMERVSLRIDSLGLEEAVAEQDSAISTMMSEALRSFERLYTRSSDGVASQGADPKAGPKDGDLHGDPSRATAPEPSRGDGQRTDGGSDSAADGDLFGQILKDNPQGDDVLNDPRIDELFRDLLRIDDLLKESAASADGDGTTDTPDGDVEPRSGGTQSGADETAAHAADDDVTDADDRDVTGSAGAGSADTASGDVASGGTADAGDAADAGEQTASGNDPMSVLHRSPTVRSLVTVTFTRTAFMERLRADALRHPIDTYLMFDAAISMDEHGGLEPTEPDFDLHDARFAPVGSQEEPELSDTRFEPAAARILGTSDAEGLSIQRADLLQRRVDEFHRLAADTTMPSVAKAQQAMRIIEQTSDPELSAAAAQVTSALIDGRDTPDLAFVMADELDKGRLHARDLLFSGQTEQALQAAEEAIAKVEKAYKDNPGVPRYFNSYAERVVYNRLFATDGERTVLIPDNLFYAHAELADVLAQAKGVKAALPHLNALVAYAPAYPLGHMKLAVQLARNEDWDSARAACLNALRVALDRDDAAFAYYRLAYAEWMRDRFDTAAAAYIMSEHIAPGHIGALDDELHELVARAQSQCIPVPVDVEEAAHVLRAHDLPVWPRTEVADIVRDAARVCVDSGLFVPARTLSVAVARMADDDGTMDMVHAQFLRSLSA
ncbi:tetratricopeptide repeat protein [Bifidobacterium leontopitheci]|nr:tetratricopeptide repeat protein [Bifidobacterium leontopitheci]